MYPFVLYDLQGTLLAVIWIRARRSDSTTSKTPQLSLSLSFQSYHSSLYIYQNLQKLMKYREAKDFSIEEAREILTVHRKNDIHYIEKKINFIYQKFYSYVSSTFFQLR
jgi:hypothetical protein